MRIFPKISCPDYDFWSDPVEEKKVMVNLPDGGKAVIRHRTLYVHFKHKKTKDEIIIRMTGRDNFYYRSTYQPKESQIHETEAIETFQRLIGADGFMAFRIAKTRLYME